MSPLVSCPACDRHVKSDETTCPFCQAALAPVRACTGCSSPLAPRLARAALVAAGAALLGAACQSSRSVIVPYGVSPQFDAGTPSDRDAGASPDGTDAAGHTADGSGDAEK